MPSLPAMTEPVFTGVPAAAISHPASFASLLPDDWYSRTPAAQTGWLSLWSHWFFAAALIPWAEQMCHEQKVCPLWEFNGQLQINDRQFPEYWLNKGGARGPLSGAGQQSALEQLIDGFISPVCTTLASYADQNLTIFWSNAAVRLWQGMQRGVEKHADVQILQTLFNSPRRQDGQVNRLCSPFRRAATRGGEPRLQRRHCCLIFRLEGCGKCASCPLQSHSEHSSRRLATGD